MTEHRVIVQKFGGTTTGDPLLRPQIYKRISETLKDGYRVIAVVSAMGRNGAPYATETLLGLLQNTRFTCRRERDLLMSCGESIAAVQIATELREFGVACIARAGFDAGIITDSEFGDARIIRIEPDRLKCDFEIYEVVVVAGFQGVSESGAITTLGRGGSDTSAIAIGAALNAERVEIYTDTEGVFSADPRIVPNARFLNEIHPEDIRQMAWQGAKVLHPRAVELAIRHDTQTRIGRVDRSANTIVTKSFEYEAIITGIACGPSVDQISVSLPIADDHAWATAVFEAVAAVGISMDMFTLTETLLRFTTPVVSREPLSQALKRLGADFSIRPNCAKVSIVGAGMHGMRGVMARFSRCLLDEGIRLIQTVDSHATISGLIRQEDADRAQIILHREFIENPDV